MNISIKSAAILATLTVTTLAATVANACPRGYATQYRSSTPGPRLNAVSNIPAPASVREVSVVVAEEAPRLAVGTSQEIEGNFFGKVEGFVLFHVNGLTIPATVTDWDENLVGFQVPNIGAATATAARMDIVLPDGRVADSVEVILTKRGAIHGRVAQPAPRSQPSAGEEEPVNALPKRAAAQGVSLRGS